MQLLNVIRARSIWLFDVQELNPRGKHIEFGLIEWLKANYHFAKYPSSTTDRDQSGGLAFSEGVFQVEEDWCISVDLHIYADGLVADTRSSTKDADAFLEQTLSLVVQDFGLVYHPEMIRRKLYVSELNVAPQQPLRNLNLQLQAFAKRLTALLGEQTPIMFELASIGFWPDPAFPTHHVPFQFERKLNIPFSEHRYYSRAPLQTEDHLQLLEEFEVLLIG
jgi:hypothetical protein